ncbi:MAG TPA: hypothetical protein VMS32_09715 [Verrucomicrobiae bacterium]|jgi:hypothetical protein|nr:hypothetical protein [Verrucomicrobiae bacterium]
MRVSTALVLVAAVLAACSGRSGSSGTPSSANPLGVPLYGGSVVVGARAFPITIDRANVNNYPAIFDTYGGKYIDREIIATSDASLDTLSDWLSGLSANPPTGYVAMPDNGDIERARAEALPYGFAFALFKRQDAGKGGALVAMAMDPAILNAHAGMAMGLIDHYRSLPAILRAAADAQLKQQTGMTGSQLIDPAMPAGAALAAYDAVKSSNQRAIVLLDARKQ